MAGIDAQTVLLLHCDGADGSTSFPDASQYARPVSALGTAQVDTALAQFGGSALLNGGWLTIPDHVDLDFAAGDFEIDFWVALVASIGGGNICTKRQAAGMGPFTIYQAGTSILLYASSNGASWDVVSAQPFASSVALGGLHHLALARQGTTFRGFWDGTQAFSFTSSATLWDNAEPFSFGAGSLGGEAAAVQLDEIRVSKGAARFSGNFVPPTAPYSPDVQAHFRSLVTYRIQIGWEVASGTLAIVGSALVDTATVGETPFDYVYGPNDDVTDRAIEQASIQRGREDPTSLFQASNATIRLRDRYGMYNPKNASSPLAGLVRPLRPVKITAIFQGVEYPRFSGFIRSLSWQPQKRGGVATLELIDLFIYLERAKPVIASTGQTTTGAAIGLLLDWVGWTSPSLRSLDQGDTILNFAADGTQTALQLIEGLLTTERGIFFIDPGGVATYRDRRARSMQATSVATIDSVMIDLQPGTSVENVKNRANVTLTGSAKQTASDLNSIFLYGPSDWPDIDSPYLLGDDYALALGNYLVAMGADPTAPVWGLTVENRDDATTQAMLSLDLMDRITVSEGQGGTAEDDFFVEGYTETIIQDANSLQIAYGLTETPPVNAAIVGIATVDGPAIVTF